MKLVEQLTLVTLQTAHHGSTSPRIASTQRNHASRPVSTDFCNKICQQQTFDALTTTPEKHPAFVRSAKANCWRSSRCGSSSRIFPNSSRSKAWYGNSRLSGQRSRLDKGYP